MAASSADVTPQPQNDNKPRDVKPDASQETVKAVADLVYAMLLRDLRQERERNRILIWNSRMMKRG